MSNRYTVSFFITLLVYCYITGCTVTPSVSYQYDVRPILLDKCIDCHIPPNGEGYKRTGLDMTSYDALMKGSIYGPVVIPRDSRKSPLNMLVEGRAGDLSRTMKTQHKTITDHEIKMLDLWVKQGARNN